MTRIDLPPEKQIGHLTLLRAPRSITSKEYNSLSFAERLSMVRGAVGSQKYRLLVEAQDAEALVRRLPAQEIYLLIKELGLTEVPELLAAADVDQFTAFLDLDCWQGDVFNARTAAEWLAVLFDGGEETVLKTVHDLNFGLLVLLLKKQINVLSTPSDMDDEDSRSEAAQHNGGYELEYRDSETGKLFATFLGFLQQQDPAMFTRLLEAVRWEQETLLEEENYQERRIRLESLGFPDSFESLAIYAWLDPAQFNPGDFRRGATADQPTSEPPAFVLTTVHPGGILAEVLAAGIDAETAWELTWLLNRVMVADRLDIGDVARVQEAAGNACRYLNLALEHLCGADVEQACRLFAGTYLQALFRLGFSLTIRLQRRARQISQSLIGPWLDGPFCSFVNALSFKKPRYFEGIEEVTRAGERPFATLQELHRAGEWLDRLEGQRLLFEAKFPFALPAQETLDLTGCYPEIAEDLALSDFFLTALGNQLLGRDFVPLADSAVGITVSAEQNLLRQPGYCRAAGTYGPMARTTCARHRSLCPFLSRHMGGGVLRCPGRRNRPSLHQRLDCCRRSRL